MIVKKIFILLIILPVFYNPADQFDNEKAYFYFYKGKTAINEGRYKSAIHHFSQAIKYEPSNIRYILAKAQACFEASEFDKAMKTLENHKSNFSSPEDRFTFGFVKGLAFALNGQHDKALLVFEQTEKLAHQISISDSTMLSHLYNNLGCEKFLNQPIDWNQKMEDKPHLSISPHAFPKAWPYFIEALKFDPHNEAVLQNIAFIQKYCECKIEKQQAALDHTIIIDNLDKPGKVKSENSTAPNLPHFVYQYLPNKIETIINTLNHFDEVLYVMDISASMEEEIEIKNKKGTRFQVMVDLAKYLTTQLSADARIGAISVGSGCDTLPELSVEPGSISRLGLLNQITGLHPNGLTPLNKILETSNLLFSDSAEQKAILLFTDGLNSCGEGNTCEIANDLSLQGIQIYILSFLLETESEEEYSVFDCIATISDGDIYEIEGQNGIEKKTLDYDPPFYSLLIPQDKIDTSFCLSTFRLKCDYPCFPEVYRIVAD
ncbi:MAG: VWA domain-containing protein [Bacteroidales bacterium]